MIEMFALCLGLKEIDISLFEINDKCKIEGMLTTCKKLETIKVNKNTYLKIKEQLNLNVNTIIC